MLGLSVIILFKSLLHVFCSLVFSAHNSSEQHVRHYLQIVAWLDPLASTYTYIFVIGETFLEMP